MNIYNGALYGTTYYEGRRIKYGGGTVFKLTPYCDDSRRVAARGSRAVSIDEPLE